MVKIEINPEQLKKAIDQLPLRERARLVEELMVDTRQARFQQLLKRIRAKARKNPISQKQLNKIIEEAREEYYAKHHR